jgi:hypothetical protein
LFVVVFCFLGFLTFELVRFIPGIEFPMVSQQGAGQRTRHEVELVFRSSRYILLHR